MANLQFSLKMTDLIYLRRFYKKAPYEFRKVMANLVNTFAFGTRRISLNIIHKRMVVRDSRFVNSRLRIKKARVGKVLSSIQSEMGSIETARFTGWAEQELGSPVKRTRVFTVMARKGDIRKKTTGESRLKVAANHITPDQYEGKTERFRTTAMIGHIIRTKQRKPFVIRRHSKYKAGLYKFIKGRITQLQQFKTKKQPPRIKWLSGATDLYFRGNRVRNEWAKSIKHVLKLR